MRAFRDVIALPGSCYINQSENATTRCDVITTGPYDLQCCDQCKAAQLEMVTSICNRCMVAGVFGSEVFRCRVTVMHKSRGIRGDAARAEGE